MSDPAARINFLEHRVQELLEANTRLVMEKRAMADLNGDLMLRVEKQQVMLLETMRTLGNVGNQVVALTNTIIQHTKEL